MRKTLAVSAMLIALTIGTTAIASALSATIGNPAIDRSHIDSWQNFTVVDTNNPAPFDGVISEVTVFGQRAGIVRFVIVDSNNEITQVSDELAVTGDGIQTLQLAAPMGVTTGSNLGVYFAGIPSIPVEGAQGVDALWNNRGVFPVVGQVVGTGFGSGQDRIYSMNAQVVATSPDLCKKGGWENYGYKNQGQCIASIVANENAGK